MLNTSVTTKVAEVLLELAMGAAKASANSKCVFIFHQPRKPEGLSSLRQKK